MIVRGKEAAYQFGSGLEGSGDGDTENIHKQERGREEREHVLQEEDGRPAGSQTRTDCKYGRRILLGIFG